MRIEFMEYLRSRFDAAVRWRARQVALEVLEHCVHDRSRENVGPHSCLSREISHRLDELSPAELCGSISGYAPGRPVFGPGMIHQSDFLQAEMQGYVFELMEQPRFHGKQWQWASILRQARLASTDESVEGRQPVAIGFGVGTEPIPALLAKWGFKVTASDYFDGPDSQEWAKTNQMVQNYSASALNDRQICPDNVFDSNVELINLDMNCIPKSWHGTADFIWSTCALGHIGGYQKGLEFILQSAKTLRPGGVAVHTTEVVVDDKDCLDSPGLSLYRRHDIWVTLQQLKAQGFSVPEHFFDPGKGLFDELLSPEPNHPDPHIKIEILGREIYNFSIIFSRPQIEPLR